MWASQYIGRPWEKFSEGPDAFNCWTFFRYVQKHHFGRDLPAFEEVDALNLRQVIKKFSANEEQHRWVGTSTPVDGDAVLMSHGRHPTHVGLWLSVDGGGVLHCIQGEGVVFSSIESLKTGGWAKMEFYKYAGNT
ncbi:NlpC/P60 family protein [Methyloversatilis sp.]|uniref:NlpC/P60 family protein n=1 Tax=Methyloversatilis sp. TaxID=2569862 RepID=UPI0035B10695